MKKRLGSLVMGMLACLLALNPAIAQQRTVTGKVSDDKGGPVIGASVTVKGTNSGTSTDSEGRFIISAAPGNVLVISSIGFGAKEVTVGSDGADMSVQLAPSAGSDLNEVVVVGYGTQRKKDLTGAVASVKAKDFNQGIQVSPDQLIQGKVPGVQVTNNSGQPGGASTIRIRGNSSIRGGSAPLFVIDGVIQDGRSARPGLDAPGIGGTPDANPLNFINPNDIVSMDVLKDASATAIYGSRGANGVVIVNTKRGQSGAPKLDVNISGGFSNVLKRLNVLESGTFREALRAYNIPSANNDWGGNVDAFDEITRTAPIQNYNVAVGGGNANGRYRLSLGYLNQQGVVRKSGLEKYTANFNGQFRFLENKNLGIDFNVITGQTNEQIAPIANNSGFEGSLIGQALQWNPTRPLRRQDGTLNVPSVRNANGQLVTDAFPNSNLNPLATSEAFNDRAIVTTVQGNIQPFWKITKNFEYRMLVGINYSQGNRRTQWANWINIQNIEGRGWANYASNELLTKQINHTLNYNGKISEKLSIGALLGYEYMQFNSKGVGVSGRDFGSNSIPYTNYLQGSTQSSRGVGSFADPTSELQSYFGRVNLNFDDRFIVTGTFRADGSSKFGKENRYGYFPSFSAAWNIKKEGFMANSGLFDALKLRAGWGVTGSQEFPAGASVERYGFTGPGASSVVNLGNPNLQWEQASQTNVGIDFSMLDYRLSGSVDYFYKNTENLLFFGEVALPGPNASVWQNLPGNIINSGVEVALNYDVIRGKKVNFNIGGNISFLRNELTNFPDLLQVLTGEINGQGLTGARAQRFANGQPLSAFWMGTFTGLDRNGVATYEGGDPNNPANRSFHGSPNPTTLYGLFTNLQWGKLDWNMNWNGAGGFKLYNNTTQATLAIGNIGNNRNIAETVYTPGALENRGNPQPVSTRYLEDGGFFKLANTTVGYNLGKLGKAISNARIYFTAQNVLVFTKFSGFDPEVNTPKNVNGVPSAGIEYTPYPSARSFLFGINFSL